METTLQELLVTIGELVMENRKLDATVQQLRAQLQEAAAHSPSPAPSSAALGDERI